MTGVVLGRVCRDSVAKEHSVQCLHQSRLEEKGVAHDLRRSDKGCQAGSPIGPTTTRPVVARWELPDGKKKAHVLMVISPERSHFDIFLQILHHLAHGYPGLAVTVVSSPQQIERLVKARSRGDLVSLDLRLKDVLGNSTIYFKDKNAKFPVGVVKAVEVQRLASEFLRKELVAHKDAPGAPTCILSSKFQYWSADWAFELGIPWFPTFPTPFLALVLEETPKAIAAGLKPGTESDIVSAVPGVVPVPILSAIQARDLFYDNREIYANISDRIRRASAVVVNASEGVDKQAGAGAVEGLRSVVRSSRVITIGPILQYPGFGFGLLDSTDTECLDWLDSQRENSVLYIAFGTYASMPTATVRDIAAGIEASGVPFLWVLRLGQRIASEELPLGFAERTRGRGRIEIGFVPQSKILSHPSTGGFFTHGGWNSLMEAVIAGKPVLAWPMGADQPLNVRYMIGLAKAAYSVSDFKEDNKHSFEDIGSREIELAVRRVMLEDDDGAQVKRNLKTMQKKVHADMAEGGSSHRNLHMFLDEIANPC